MNGSFASSKGVFDALRGFSRRGRPKEQCELCGVAVSPEHAHVLQHSDNRIMCACEACAILFSHRGQARRFTRIPREIRRIENFQMTDVEWSMLRLPIDLAFFLRNSSAGRVIAFYPSPAGPTESLLSLEAWDDIVRNNPVLTDLQSDVEALLVNRIRDNREYYIAPLDECYKLTGLIRIHWRGFSGGEEAWRQIDQFFASLRERASNEVNRACA